MSDRSEATVKVPMPGFAKREGESRRASSNRTRDVSGHTVARKSFSPEGGRKTPRGYFRATLIISERKIAN